MWSSLQPDGSGFPFFHWEDAYIDLLASKHKNRHGDESRMYGVNLGCMEQIKDAGAAWEEADGFNGNVWAKEHPGCVAIGKELVNLVKALCLICVCILFVSMLILLVQITK